MHTRTRTWALCCLAGSLLAAGVRAEEEGIQVPLQVFEAIRQGATGVDRQGGPVSVGVPFTEEMAVAEKDGRPALALQGAGAWQFRTMARWPGGHVRWALASFPADCKANADSAAFTITRGDGASGQPAMGSLTPDGVAVDTGPLQATIRRSGFNLFDRVVVDGVEVVAPGSAGAVLIGRTAAFAPRPGEKEVTVGREGTFLASADGRTELKLEENGPARCVVYVRGSHRDTDGNRMFGYFARLYFYRGQRQVRVVHTLTHDSAEQPTVAPYPPFQSLSLRTRLAGGGAVAVRAATAAEPASARPAAGSPVVYRQGWPKSGFQMTGTTQWFLGLPPESRNDPKFQGYRVTAGEKVLAAGEAGPSPDLAWMDVAREGGAGVTVGIRFAAGNFPKTLSADADGVVDVGLYPGEGTRWGVGRGSHNTQEVLYSFHAKAASDPAADMFRFQYPLVARAPVAWYNRNTAEGQIYPLYHIVGRDEERALGKRNGWPEKHNNRGVHLLVWRGWYWGEGGFKNQSDFARVAFMNFLRDDKLDRAGEYYLWAEDRFGYNADWSVRHGAIGSFGGKIVFEFEHRHWYGLPLFGWASGEQRIADAGDEYLASIFDELASGNSFFGWPRVFGWNMYSLGAGYELTGEPRYPDAIRRRVSQMLSGKTNLRLDPLRGAYCFSHADWRNDSTNATIKPALMFGYIQHDGMYEARRALPWDDPAGEALDGMLEGIERLMARECFYTGQWNGHRKTYLLYVQSLNKHPEGSSKNDYWMTGESLLAELAPILANGCQYRPHLLEDLVESSYEQVVVEYGFTFLDHPNYQSALYEMLHGPRRGGAPEAVADLKAEPLGGGKVRLTWTSPPGAARVRVRYASLPMAEDLNYLRDERRFELDPAKSANWWAAQNVQGEPPARPGEVQSLVVNAVPAGRQVFALRSWSATSVRSPISNQPTVEVK